MTVTYNIGQKEKDELDFYAVKKKYAPRNAKEERLTLKNAGIKNGTVITKWNGKTIDSYFDEITYYFNQNPVLANEEFYLPTYVAGIGKNMAYGETYVQGKKDNENPFVTTGFLDENDVERDVWTLSYVNLFDDWGKGYTTEGMKALMDHAVKVYGAHSFEGECAKENAGGAKVLRKLGMTYDHSSSYAKNDGSATFESDIYVLEIGE